MLASPQQAAERSHNTTAVSRPFDNVTKPTYLGTRIRNQNYMYENFKIILNSETACRYSVKNLFFSSFLSTYKKSKMQKTVL
jgi:hypothetical protein